MKRLAVAAVIVTVGLVVGTYCMLITWLNEPSWRTRPDEPVRDQGWDY